MVDGEMDCSDVARPGATLHSLGIVGRVGSP